MNLFELFVKIGVDDQASDKISSLSSKLGNGLKTAAKVGTAAVGAASTAIGVLGKIGLEYNSQMEQYTTNFTTMLGSQEAAVQKVQELKEFAASTPLSMDDLAQGTQTLLAFGVESKNSTEILRQFGDIALGDADKMQRLSTAFGKATASGKVTGDTVQQMIDAGWNPLIQISKAAGETMEETQKRMSAGAISVEELQAAMEAVTSGTGQFAGGMEAASHTTQGLISTLQDNVKSKIGEAFQSVSDILQSEVLPRAIEFVNSINVDSIIENVNGLVSTFIELSPVIAAATAATLAYKAAVSISEVIDVVRKATEGQTVAQAALNAVMNANPFALVATLIAAVGTALVTLYMTNEDFRDKVTAAWSTVKDTISNVISALKTFFTTTLPNAIDTAVDWLENLPDKFREVGANLLEGLWNGIADKVEWLKGKVSGVVNTIKEWFTGKDGFDVHSPSRVFATIGEFVIEGLAIGMENSKGEVMETAKDIIDDVKERFNSLPNVLTAIQDQSAQESVVEDAAALDKFSQSAKNAFSAFEGFGDSLRDVGELIGSDIVSGIGEMIDDMTSGVSTVLNFATSLATLTETITTLKEAINALKASEGIAGIVSSIGNMLGIGAAGAAAGTAGAAAAGGAGILAVIGEVLSGPVGWALLAAGAIGAIGLGIAAATKNKNVSSTAQGAGNAIDYRDIQDAYWYGNERAFAGYDFRTDPYIYHQKTSAMNSYQQRMQAQIERLTDLVQEYLPQTANMQMVLDDGTLVGALTPSINSQLGQLEILAERGNI